MAFVAELQTVEALVGLEDPIDSQPGQPVKVFHLVIDKIDQALVHVTSSARHMEAI